MWLVRKRQDASAVTPRRDSKSGSAVTAPAVKPAVTPARGKAPRQQLTRKRAEELAAAQNVSVSTIYRRHRQAGGTS